MPLRRSALSVCPCGHPRGTPLRLDPRAPVKPSRGQTLRLAISSFRAADQIRHSSQGTNTSMETLQVQQVKTSDKERDTYIYIYIYMYTHIPPSCNKVATSLRPLSSKLRLMRPRFTTPWLTPFACIYICLHLHTYIHTYTCLTRYTYAQSAY